ncbi:MAG: arsenate reductase [Hydrocarboniphaga sp.]|uniref:ArsC/Spx/MgsR family protein n=1 Tax=Hydrocarboniphaga sp. TaxID=2033016 RepID=UPI0026031217|nr:ArsC/Spx/MgsR family protein [Hydrocarboniphaga sp.]MDB5972915.1 arsenate reductase [Hydrocarboniphaga sp.]
MVIVYGIKNCDTVQRALKALDAAGIAHRFQDFKTAGLSVVTAQGWIAALGVDVVVNRKGTTWRRLDETTRESLTASNAAALLAREPSLVKRPVFAYPGGLAVGFAKADEAAVLGRLASSVRSPARPS